MVTGVDRYIEIYAKEHNIPIMEKDGIEFLINYIKDSNIKSILEIGTAIGYSSIKMALVDPNITITTIERDKERYSLAIDNINKCNLSSQIKVIFADALNIELEDKFDFIFIDAAKSQSIKFFERYEKNLNFNGTIITDNMNFHGLVDGNLENLSKNVKGIITKIKLYKKWLDEKEDYLTEYLNIGDGLAVSKKI